MQQERESEQSATETQFDRLSSEHGEIRALAAELRAVLGRRAAAGSASDPELAVLLETFAARLGAHVVPVELDVCDPASVASAASVVASGGPLDRAGKQRGCAARA